MAVTANPAPVIALVGNPNVGKSTVFNALTNLHQHTGNWPGKTVATARGLYTYHGRTYTLVDVPSTYSLHPSSAEEEVTRDYLLSGEADVTLVVVDATCLERNLALVLQVLERVWPVVVCVNLLDEAAKKGIQVDLSTLRSRLGVPVVGAAARSGQGLEQLRQSLEEAAANPPPRPLEAAGCAGCPGCEECQAASTVARAVRLAGEVTQRFRPCLRQQLLKPFILHQGKYLSFQMRNVAVHGMVLLLRQLTGNFLDILRGFFQI